MSTGPGWWSQVTGAALDLMVPQECAGCGAGGLVWCPGCARQCAAGSLAIPAGITCRAACEHAGPAGRAVVAFKDAQVRRLARPLAEMLARAVADALVDAGALAGAEATGRPPAPGCPTVPGAGGPRAGHPSFGGSPVWLVPVPSRRAAVRARGADHTAVLAGRAAGLLRAANIPANRGPALVHVRTSRDQRGLGREDRRINVAHTLRAHDLPPGLVVVVDDVTTTGATIQEAERAFRAAGRQVACAATVTWARGPRHLASESHAD